MPERGGTSRSLGALLAGLLLLTVVACSAAPTSNSKSTTDVAVGQSASESAAAPAPAVAPPLAPGSSSAGAPPAAAPATTDAVAAPAPWDRMVIRTSNLSLTVANVEETMSALRSLAQANEGYVQQSQSQYKGDFLTVTMTLQLPARAFDDVIQQARKLAVKVDSEQTSGQDVTEEYVDLQAQVKNLQATEASLQKLLDRATKIDDVLSIQRELTNVRGQIERIQGRVNYLQRRSDMSTLVVSLISQAQAQEIGPAGAAWQPIRTIAAAWKSSLNVVVEVLDALLSILVFSWWLIPIVVLIVWLVRRNNRARRQARAAALAAGTTGGASPIPPAGPPATATPSA